MYLKYSITFINKIRGVSSLKYEEGVNRFYKVFSHTFLDRQKTYQMMESQSTANMRIKMSLTLIRRLNGLLFLLLVY